MGKSKKAKTHRFYIEIGSKICSRSAHIWPKELAPRGALLLWQKIVAPLGPISIILCNLICKCNVVLLHNSLMSLIGSGWREMLLAWEIPIIFLNIWDWLPSSNMLFSVNRNSSQRSDKFCPMRGYCCCSKIWDNGKVNIIHNMELRQNMPSPRI